MELDILYRLSMTVGFLLAGFLALLIAGVVAALWHWGKASLRELNQALKELEEACKDDDES